MTGFDRRKFLLSGAGTAGIAVLALSGSRSAAAAPSVPGVSGAPVDAGAVDGMVVHISNAAKGEATIMGVDNEIVVIDRALVAAVARAARAGKRGA